MDFARGFKNFVSNRVILSVFLAVGIVAALFYSVPAMAFSAASSPQAVDNVNGTRNINVTVLIAKDSNEAVANVSAALMVNGSTAGTTLGSDYVYATNCTPDFYGDYDLNGSGYGTLYYGNGSVDSTGIGYGYGYVYGSGYGVNNGSSFACTFNFKNLEYSTAYVGAYVYVNDIYVGASTFSATVYIFNYPTLFSTIKTALLLSNISTNMDTCGSTPTACTNLNFNRSMTVTGVGAVGSKITFTDTLDLTSSATVSMLQNLGTLFNATNGSLTLNADAATVLKNANATIVMFGLPTMGAGMQPSLTVSYTNGTAYGNISSFISNIAYDGSAGTYTFKTGHFSKFDLNWPTWANGSISLGANAQNEVIINSSNTAAGTITIPSNVTVATLNVTALLATTGVNSKSAVLPAAINVSSTNSSALSGAVAVQFPSSLNITGPANWTGELTLPTVQALTSVSSATMDLAGYTTTTNAVIEVGFGDTVLTFDKGVRILVPGMAAKSVAYVRSGVKMDITTACTNDSQITGNALAAGADCYIAVGSDIVIWTKHFTQFVAYTRTQNPVSSSSSSSYSVPAYGVTTATPTATPTAKVTVTPTSTATVAPTASATVAPTATVAPSTTAPTATTTAAGTTTAGVDNGVWMWVIGLLVVAAAAFAYTKMNSRP